jgi:hypothetical protein
MQHARSLAAAAVDADDADEILTPKDFEREFKIPTGTQGAMRSRGQIPFFRLGGGRIIRYRRSDLIAWLNQRAVAVGAGR